MLSSWTWCQTVGPGELTPPCLAWPCGSLTYWLESRSLTPGQQTSCYLLQCGWLGSSIHSPSSHPSCKLWLEGRTSVLQDIKAWRVKYSITWFITIKHDVFVVDRNEWPLDSMCLQCDVTKKTREDFRLPPREGAYVHGLYMEGACWDTQVHTVKEVADNS